MKPVKQYINPCVKSKIVDGNIYTIFPVINGISLLEFKKYLNKLDKPMYYKIVKKMFRNMLHAMGNIHNTILLINKLNLVVYWYLCFQKMILVSNSLILD